MTARKIVRIEIRPEDGDTTFYFENDDEPYNAGEFLKDSHSGWYMRELESVIADHNSGPEPD